LPVSAYLNKWQHRQCQSLANRNSKVSFSLTPCFSKVHPLPLGASTVSTVFSLFRNLCFCHGPEAAAVRTISSLIENQSGRTSLVSKFENPLKAPFFKAIQTLSKIKI
jgi:hypothetical protein